MSTTIKYNSRGQRIEELDTHIYQIDTRGPFQSPKPTSPKRKPPFEDPSDNPLEYTNLAPPFTNLAPPFTKVDKEAEILAWCEAYQNLKKRGINIYKF